MIKLNFILKCFLIMMSIGMCLGIAWIPYEYHMYLTAPQIAVLVTLSVFSLTPLLYLIIYESTKP
jgi:ABC-type nitrate/sulfonate/bicarbonate transport system permease component